jgi:hypothetical protein
MPQPRIITPILSLYVDEKGKFGLEWDVPQTAASTRINFP